MDKTKMIDNFQEVRSIDNSLLNTSNCLPCGKPKNKLSNTCIHDGCKTIPTFNMSGEKKGLYCFAHKLDGMMDVKNKTCIHPECKTRPIFNTNSETKGLYCSAHKLDGMVDVINKTCIHPGCKVLPSCNKHGETKPLYCFAHKMSEMVDVKSKTCIYQECKTRPSFNIEGETTGLYCSTHKMEDMVNVKDKTCVHPECKTRPHYNNAGEKKGLYCSTHKIEDMVNVISPTCIHAGCKTRPTYNVDGDKTAIYCFAHKLHGMVDVHHKMCKTYLCSTQVHGKYDGYCLFCYMNLFPDKPVSRNYKTKEYSVVEYVKSKYPTLTWIADKIINDGCSKRRPDLLLDLGYQNVIVEVDENKHTDYDCSCENKRIMELSQDLGHRPIVFIRFNPDDYNQNGTTITSCWGRDKTGICIVKKTKKNEWMQRLSALEEQINYWINPVNKTDKTVETIQLFYDV
jgi:hypothetical protein